jgi:hypothetical protein
VRGGGEKEREISSKTKKNIGRTERERERGREGMAKRAKDGWKEESEILTRT